ncbi:hypothetical protein B6U99_03005 [Candidatus Geothermarchaeota archaeon ex4572_27]|nr:MAG: hypothetical protein B6U99_03005 [Candidatus Geothermarchaeota archaeon ex4572_27]
MNSPGHEGPKAARDSMESGNREWACPRAQQAAVKAVKATLHGHGVGVRRRGVA